ncbi:uncharacterized protein LOC143566039 [Bidens hawaiensis]|uniref:uncharacterized protein LOC143566039 n=1 Tax=Bidens hawaiensis TaxID=980011 RepID=UPI00404B2E04
MNVGDPAQKYKLALCVTVSFYVSVKLSGRSNYHMWKAEMLCLLEDKKLLHIIIAEYPFPENKGVHMIPKYDKLVKGWIFTTMHEQLLEDFADYSSVQHIWRELESRFNRPISYREEGGSWINALDVSALREDLRYIQVSNVNVSNFVTVKLSGRSNHPIWKAQMLCLLKTQELLHIIEVEVRYPWYGGHMTEKYDNLVRGWILGTMNDQLLQAFSDYYSVQNFWKELEKEINSLESDSDSKETGKENLLDPPKSDSDIDTEDSIGFTFEKEPLGGVPEMKNTDNMTRNKELYEAAIEGCWWKAKSILKVHKKAATETVNINGDTILHLAVEMGHNSFVEKLLEVLKQEDIKLQNKQGRTALHIAAMVDNAHTAQLLVQKMEELLKIKDHKHKSPLDIANVNRKLNISTYLMKSSNDLSSALISDKHGYSKRVSHAIQTAIFTKQYDLAEKLLEKVPDYAHWTAESILMAITVTFPTDLSFMESFIFPSFDNVYLKTVLRDSLRFHYKCVDDILSVMKVINNMCCNWLERISMLLIVPIATLYALYQLICLLFLLLRLTFSMLYFLLWKVLAAIRVPTFKNIEKKKIEYQKAKKILSMICVKMGESNNWYRKPFLEAVRQDTYEVVDEILFKSRHAINYKDEHGHNIIQLAIINRSEKIYNLIHHIIQRSEFYRTMTDPLGNNLVHLAGRLAPSFVLNRTTGAALQLQRELIWREEVEKLMLPLELMKKNKNAETPAEVFTEQYKDLMKQGEAWMKTTAESCSITATLIVTIVFAAAITVPDGSDQQSGIPVFKKESAFTIFALFNAFSLFTATTSLLLFLSILTARYSEKDFLVSLPRRLILGLFTLFLSTTAMMVAFGAILYLVFCDHRPWMLAPICVFACLPISVIVTIKLPRLVDLIQSTYIPIFGKQSYLESCKISRKNTLFTK